MNQYTQDKIEFYLAWAGGLFVVGLLVVLVGYNILFCPLPLGPIVQDCDMPEAHGQERTIATIIALDQIKPDYSEPASPEPRVLTEAHLVATALMWFIIGVVSCLVTSLLYVFWKAGRRQKHGSE
ncbi:MAG: hypothetical protein OXC46_00190 [Thaumarchaeota archaeon]|nr:hypothetical protein [Nitrososphaerota archaeon]